MRDRPPTGDPHSGPTKPGSDFKTTPASGSQPPATADATAIPSKIGIYPILGELGRGGMGVVYIAEDPRLGRRIALKVVPDRVAHDPKWIAQFHREARLLAATNHPNIATIFSLEDVGDRHFLTMELILGQSLADRLQSGPLPIGEVLNLARQLARALEAAHREGIVHRDLKPLNVMVTREDQVKVLDFGLAVTLSGGGAARTSDENATARAVAGTPGYMSPEQLRGEAVDTRSDIWTFGCIVYECLTGQRIFPGETPSDRMQAALTFDPDFDQLPAETPPSLRDLLARCLQRKIDHRLGSIAEARRILEEEIARRSLPPIEYVPRDRAEAHPNNLPHQLSSFVGRETETDDVARMLDDHRLVTLTGVGGGGKTRLALHLAEQILDRFPDGIWWIELGPLSDCGLIAQTVATTLGVTETAGQPIAETLTAWLRGKDLLLVLDNCEHLLDVCAELMQDLLRENAELRVLATSREALTIDGEAVYPVPPLAVPGDETKLELEALREIEAVDLFSRRVCQVQPDFRLTEQNVPEVVEICRRLDGIPLALELAASRARALPIEEIARRIDKRFRLLTSGTKNVLPRHRTLRALIDWSYEQLDDQEKLLFQRLAVFSGGWTLEAAETICGEDGIEDWELLDLLTHLINKSLVEPILDPRASQERARYRMLESVREYALERLAEGGAEKSVRDRHLIFFADLAEEAAPKLTGPEQAQWMARLDAEQENIRTAFELCGDPHADPAHGMRMTGSLLHYWLIRGTFTEARRTCKAMLEHPKGKSLTSDRGRTLNAMGSICYRQGDLDDAKRYYEEGIRLFEKSEDPTRSASLLLNLGSIELALGEIDKARDLYRRSLAIQREKKDLWGISAALSNLGNLAEAQADYDEAETLAKENLTILQEIGDPARIGNAHLQLGVVAYRKKDYDEAVSHYEKSLTLMRDLGHKWGIGAAQVNLGQILLKRGQLDRARDALLEALEIFEELNERATIAVALEGFGDLAAEGKAPRRAVRLLGAGDALREAIHLPMTPASRADLEKGLAKVREAIGEDAVKREWDAGRALSIEEAIALARSEIVEEGL